MPAHTPHHIHSASQPPALQRYTRKAASTAQLSQNQAATIEGLISKPPASLTEALQDLRYLILTQGVAADTDGNSNLRIYIWSILLGVAPMRTNEYVTLVRRGASSSYSKIRNDTFRTLATDPLFRRRVSESSIIRLLNAFQWKMKDTGEDAQYVQGMNVIAAPFLYAARSEVEAFSLFAVFIQRECPGYVRPTMEGVHSGLKLVDQVLETVDQKLYTHLQSKFLTAELYAFPSVLTLSACTPPLPEVLKLWDFLLAYGAHLNILCVVAQLLLMRDELLTAQSPMKLLRQFPPLNAKTIITAAVGLVKKIPSELFDQVVDHAR
ncbi:rab-GTPase-TBC domain-containing protein [Trichophaea hybrida]|nr:rab-GTPase-TBC domain-containing protein [Trichophaea hybrida]